MSSDHNDLAPAKATTVPSSASNRRAINLALVVIGTFAAALSAFLWYEMEKGWTPSKVEREIQLKLPPGSTRPQVEAWLDSIHPDGSFYVDRYYFKGTTNLGLIGNQTPLQLSGLPPDQIAGAFRATFHSANVNLIFAGWIDVYFFFDKNDRLLGHYLTWASL
jgi:hypothetical protein